jgi:protein TonB
VGHEAVETAGDTADTREELLARAENALLAARLSEAATAIEAARRAGVEPGRLAFLNAQLIKSREQLKPGATSYHSKAVERPAELAAESSTDHPTQASSAVAPQPEQFDATGPDASSKPEATVQDLPAPVQEIGAVEPRIVAASALTLVKSVPPSYPTRAAQEALEGWVELEFTVASSGAVKNITVRAASPAGVFDSAAERALSRWRYQPVLRDGIPSEQRASIRIRFTLKN